MEQRAGIAPVQDEASCFHCLDTGWVMLTAENDLGELEDYFVLCRKLGNAAPATPVARWA